MGLCELCKSNEADKKNSHIISKFLTKGLFASLPHRHSIEIKRKGSNKKIQDTIKVDFIFCSYCEKRMEILETYFAKELKSIYAYKKNNEDFKKTELNGQQYLECVKISPNLYKLFFYLQAWRTSISTSKNFSNYKLPYDCEVTIRTFLNSYLKNSHKDLLSQRKMEIQTPEFINCLVIPKEINKNTRGIFTAYEFHKGSFLILVQSFAFMLFTDQENIHPTYQLFSNAQNFPVKIFLGDNETWNDFNKKIIHKLIN